MSYRTNASVDARRAALEELRTAHRILLATPPPGALERFCMMMNRAMPGKWPSDGQTMWADAGVHAESELTHACACIRRALALLDGVLRVDLRRVDPAQTAMLDRFVVDLFGHVRAAEPPLDDVDPLSTEK